jgi:hypothetical protein
LHGINILEAEEGRNDDDDDDDEKMMTMTPTFLMRQLRPQMILTTMNLNPNM